MKRKWLAIALFIALTACQPKMNGPQISVEEAWGRPSPIEAGNGAAYMLIKNTGNENDVLIGISSEISNAVELHDMTMENDVMKMFPVESIDIPAGGSIELKPGGKHVMFIGLHNKLEVGQIVTIVLKFEKVGNVSVDVEIQEP